jgi:hypothetical protein
LFWPQTKAADWLNNAQIIWTLHHLTPLTPTPKEPSKNDFAAFSEKFHVSQTFKKIFLVGLGFELRASYIERRSSIA